MLELSAQTPVARPSPSPVMGRMTIGQVARRTGLTSRAIRLYEAHGFIAPPRDRNDVRCYDSEAVARLEHIAFLRRAGFTLKEVGAVIAANRQGPAAVRRRTIEIARKRLGEVDREREELERLVGGMAMPRSAVA